MEGEALRSMKIIAKAPDMYELLKRYVKLGDNPYYYDRDEEYSLSIDIKGILKEIDEVEL